MFVHAQSIFLRLSQEVLYSCHLVLVAFHDFSWGWLELNVIGLLLLISIRAISHVLN